MSQPDRRTGGYTPGGTLAIAHEQGMRLAEELHAERLRDLSLSVKALRQAGSLADVLDYQRDIIDDALALFPEEP